MPLAKRHMIDNQPALVIEHTNYNPSKRRAQSNNNYRAYGAILAFLVGMEAPNGDFPTAIGYN